jgi:hypothetical protein
MRLDEGGKGKKGKREKGKEQELLFPFNLFPSCPYISGTIRRKADS